MADITKQDLGPVSALAGSKKYGITAIIVGAGIGLSIYAIIRGDPALSISAIWPAAIAVSAYVIGQACVEACAALRKP